MKTAIFFVKNRRFRRFVDVFVVLSSLSSLTLVFVVQVVF